jgi:hypothetical protein
VFGTGVENTLPNTLFYYTIPAYKPSGSKYVEGVININIILEKVHFVSLYCAIVLQCIVQKNIKIYTLILLMYFYCILIINMFRPFLWPSSG